VDFRTLKLIYAGAFWFLVFLVVLWVAGSILQITLDLDLEKPLSHLWDAVLIGMGFIFGGIASLLVKN
jgi:hypothetical protein